MQRITHKIDVAGKVLGRVASEIAYMLRGKDQVGFQPHVDAGAIIVVSNVSQLKFTGKKLDQKEYFHHSGYPGGIKSEGLQKRMNSKPEEVLIWAVYNMLPKNRSRKQLMKRLQFVK